VQAEPSGVDGGVALAVEIGRPKEVTDATDSLGVDQESPDDGLLGLGVVRD
jgi:hypothetical protein